MTGVSYLAIIQWWVASLQPTSLAAINPCEGLTDPYREFVFHGGIRDTGFPPFWQRNRLKYSTSKVEALADMAESHPFDDEYWASKRPDLSKVRVPAFVIASWSDQGLHTRGTLAAFEQIASDEKFLEIHGRKKWEHFHQPSTFARQRAFFDRFLKEESTEADSWPRVRYELRDRPDRGVNRTADEWPPADRTLRTLHLDATDGTLADRVPAAAANIRYEASQDGGEAIFDHVFDRRSDVLGAACLRLWITAEDAEDADLFVGLRKLDVDGRPVELPLCQRPRAGSGSAGLAARLAPRA